MAGPLSAGGRAGGKGERAIEELELEEGGPPRLMVMQSHGSFHNDKVSPGSCGGG